jgi:hypothetical protein
MTRDPTAWIVLALLIGLFAAVAAYPRAPSNRKPVRFYGWDCTGSQHHAPVCVRRMAPPMAEEARSRLR